jgi:hypothetical protein
MMLGALLLPLLLTISTPSVPPTLHGSVVVFHLSSDGSYIAIASESRAADQANKAVNDNACKIVPLSTDTLFFLVGSGYIRIIRKGSKTPVLWTGTDEARSLYARGRKRNTASWVAAWEPAVRKIFSAIPSKQLNEMKGWDDSLVTGGFIHYEKGAPSLEATTLYMTGKSGRLTFKRMTARSGQIGGFGVGIKLAMDFIEARTPQAAKARAVWRGLGDRDPTLFASFLKSAVQYAIDNAKGDERGQIGGPIDVALLQRGQSIRWVAQKPNCSH